ncbi:hypothetical protein ASPSYDRAFT_93530 [Aspergillus sydowii CBS 593.65]|uniref:Uncharacterized protein n=1 Tax=Aspergillus sydowii CBS 593.65 TaxID=1036612 RepID=A0A1L9T595_9EURO|nr:uncharacterized protein ASPSYDRAFT_93530 [Aspergillus sydowii CBS 593.65]OJJ54614.1 hypothetical protein ASPSYDRAFT_93530 [Aspergillus sydowii CBS 593.65]
MAIVTNKGVAAVQTALANNGLSGYISEGRIIGDKTPGAERKPATTSFTNALVPRLREIGHAGPWLGMDEEVVVYRGHKGGYWVCQEYWRRSGYGDTEACETSGPDWIVDGLTEIACTHSGR